MEIPLPKADLFFGRGEISALLEKRLEAFQKGYRQNVGIIGRPFLGKTALMHILSKSHAIRHGLLPILVSCFEFDSFKHFAERWMGSVLIGCYQNIRGAAPVCFQEMLRVLKPLIPKTIRKMKGIKKSILAKREDQAYRELLTLSGLVHEETGKKILLILDDFDRLNTLGLKDPFSAFGQEIMIEKDTLYVVTSSFKTQSKSIFRDQLSLLFGNFEVVELRPLHFDEARAFVTEYFSDLSLEPEIVQFMIRITDGHPHYLNILAKRFELCRSSGALPSSGREFLFRVLADELVHDIGLLRQHFLTQLFRLSNGKPWPLYGDVLAAVAVGHKKFLQINRFLSRDSRDIKKALERLVDQEAIEQHGNQFLLTDSLLRIWLQTAYYPRRFSFHPDRCSEEQAFLDQMEQLYQIQFEADQKDPRKRVEELFKCFRNESIELDEKRFACVHFSEVISKPNNGRVFPVLAHGPRGRWLCQVLSAKVAEADIHVFLEDVKQLRAPIQKKLIFGLHGIDLNAKLLAQEAKIQYLDLKQLNFLLDWYDKPKLVL